MISEYDLQRIRDDAEIAINALGSIAFANTLHPDYIKEKIEKAQTCIDFIKGFASE